MDARDEAPTVRLAIPSRRPGSTAWRASVAACVVLVVLTTAGVGGLWWSRTHPAAPVAAAPIAAVAPAAPGGTAPAPPASRTPRTPTSTPTSAARAAVSGYAGSWEAHGIAIEVDGTGRGVLSFRTYTPCDLPSPGVPCEPLGAASDAGHGVIQLRTSSSGSLQMRVVSSNDQPDWPTGKVYPVRVVRHGVLQVGTGDTAWGLCLPPASDASCGA